MKYPITPEYLAAVPDPIVKLYEDLEEYIIRKICESLNVSGEPNATALELIRELQRRGMPLDEIEAKIRKTAKLSQKELDKCFDNAVQRNNEYYGNAYDKLGLIQEEAAIEQFEAELDAIMRQTHEGLRNITRSMGFGMRGMDGSIAVSNVQETYQNILDKATIKVLSGTESYNEAISSGIREMTDSGLISEWVEYRDEEGNVYHRNRTDVAVRRAVMTGVTQVSSQYSEQAAEDFETPYREVSAHPGARDKGIGWQDHKSWQGKVYSIHSGDIYPSIYAVCGWGQVDGLEGANCRHMHYPWIEGVSERAYTDEELANIDKPPFTFEGKQYTAYEATQKQRQIERALRSVKRRILAEKAAGLDYTADAVKYRRLNEEYDKFSKAAGLVSQKERSFIKEFGPGDAKEANRIVKSRDAMLKEFSDKMTSSGYQIKGFDEYYGDKETLDHMSTALTRMKDEFPEEAKGTIVNWGYSKDETEFGWYDKEKGQISFNKKIMGNWKDTASRYEKTVKENESPQGTDANAVFYHEFGHRVWAQRNGGSLTKVIDKIFSDFGYGHVSTNYREELLSKELCSYATFDVTPRYEEALAESFGEWYNSLTPRRFCEALLKEVGII